MSSEPIYTHYKTVRVPLSRREIIYDYFMRLKYDWLRLWRNIFSKVETTRTEWHQCSKEEAFWTMATDPEPLRYEILRPSERTSTEWRDLDKTLCPNQN